MAKTQHHALRGIQNILIGLTEEGRGDEAHTSIGYGLTLAAAAGAHLTVQAASRRIDVSGTMFPTLVGSFVSGEIRRLDALAHAVAERAAGDAAMAGVVCTTEAPSLSHANIIVRLTQQARLHDLTILDAEPIAVSGDRELIEAVLLDSGRPIIVVPPTISAFSATRIVVAWDGSAPAARALNDALPFLRAADTVDLVAVVEGEDLKASAAGTEIAPHLARHGIAANVIQLPVQVDVARSLQRHVHQSSADMLVIGGFGHSRMRELFFSGVTQWLLGRSGVPLFIAH